MKKAILLVVFLVLAFTAYKIFSPNKPVGEDKKDSSLSVSSNSGSFNGAIFTLIGYYNEVKSALVDWDTLRANQAALKLGHFSDSLSFKELKADSSIVETAANFASSMSGECKGFLGEASIEQKRRSFNMLTDELYNLIRTVQYSGEIIYHIRCPMAFDDSLEGFWLNNSNKIINPYLGRKHPKYNDKMVGCGEVVDSLNFGKK